MRRLRSAWEPEGLPVAVRGLGLIALAGGLSALLASVFPANPAAPIKLLRIVGIAMLCGSLFIWWRGNRIPHWFLHVAVVIGTLSISLLIARSATGVGMVVTASDYVWLGVYAAFFFSRAAARAHVAVMAAAFGVALIANSHHVPVDAWIFMTASLVVATETIGRQSDRLRHEAHTDSLTGLLNRKGLAPAAERAFSLADRTDIPLTIALIDLDDFKQVNDRDGHAAGDRLLAEMTHTWAAELEPSDIFARLGGDEFLVLLVGSSTEETERLFDRLRFSSPTAWSAGVITRKHGEELSACLARADGSLYEAKRSKRMPAAPVGSAPPPRQEAHLETTR
jgi:diguanylate cyclase (GGDEF)-like protein